ncbi:MAG: undecaprenyldiphospho-muramoylpentapeptide beta-N-acetylglucosaminyltransferase [Lachnospiraceae bacterium]|nr:undecaprenyldiphospho-muramoylpentapeptide beta-N-acetylglucosaminyltransferase [Lachnospiraceae bacterium]
MSKKIILTGGGTAGHVTPNMALIPGLKKHGFEIKYVGSYDGIEKKLIEEIGVDYEGISSGKLRRYLSAKNLTDPFRVVKGYSEAKKIMKEYAPDIVFSKGGFVSVPVVLAAKKYKIPVIIHESDMTPGLANKLSISAAHTICHNFPETAQYLPNGKSLLTGSPIREELRSGDKLSGLTMCGFHSNKPVIMIIGGSLGAASVNQAVRDSLDELLKKYQVVHLCGKGKMDESLNNISGYKQFEYIKSELKDLFAMTDLVISRAGANAICEIVALRKPNVLIPLSAKASRGDQILNAASFKNQGFSEVIEEENLTPATLVETVNMVYDNRDKYIASMDNAGTTDAVSTIIDLIEKTCAK